MFSSRVFLSAALLASVIMFGAVEALASPIVTTIGGTTVYSGNDDGTYPAAGSNAGTPPGTPVAQSLGFSFNFYGNIYTTAYINNNGNITFVARQATYTPFALTGPTGNPLLAPFFADVDTRTGATATFGTGLYNGLSAFAVNWFGVGYYSQHTDKTNTFQLLLVDRSDIAAGDADIYYNYGSMQWETGDASSGVGGLGGNCARVGFNSGNGTSIEVPGSGTCGALIDGGSNQLLTASNDGVAGQYLFQVRNGQVSNIPEPGSLALLFAGLVGVGLIRRRRG